MGKATWSHFNEWNEKAKMSSPRQVNWEREIKITPRMSKTRRQSWNHSDEWLEKIKKNSLRWTNHRNKILSKNNLEGQYHTYVRMKKVKYYRHERWKIMIIDLIGLLPFEYLQLKYDGNRSLSNTEWKASTKIEEKDKILFMIGVQGDHQLSPKALLR